MIRHVIAPAYLLACLILGGASAAGFAANLVLQLAAIPLIGWSVFLLVRGDVPSQARTPLRLLALFVAIAVVQLIPLPPALWTMLPGRASTVEGYRLLGEPLPWLPLSLAPTETLASLLWLLPAFAILMAILIAGAFRGRNIAGVIVGVALTAVVLGAFQVIGGKAGYFYSITNYGVAVGFFANSNHNATLMLVSIPFLAALQTIWLKKRTSLRSASAVRLLVTAAYAVIGVGLLLNGSVAGVGLAVPTALFTWLMFGRLGRVPWRIAIPATMIIAVAVIGMLAFGTFDNNLFGQQDNYVELSRQTSFALTWDAAGIYFPFGSGIGSFQPIYRMQEPLNSIGTTFMNHAHNDWFELLLETGLVGIIFAALFLFWFTIQVRKIWSAEEREPFAQAAAIAMGVIMLHSIVDYPLRTAALSSIFAACIGLVSGVRPHVFRSRSAPTARHLTL